MQPERTILYIDDEPENLSGFELLFRKQYRIFKAADALAGRKILDEEEIQVVVSDQRMPGKTGIEFFEEISIDYPDVIRILLTAFTDLDAIIDAINRGKVYHYLNKPYDINNFRNILEKAFETYYLRKQNQKLLSELQQKNSELQDALFEAIKNEEKFRNILNYSIDGIIITDLEHTILDSNENVALFLGTTREELKNKKSYHFLHPDDVRITLDRLELLKKGENLHPVELRCLKPDGTLHPIETNSKIINFNNVEALLTLIRDISERKMIEQKILNTIIQTEEKERSRISKELHDGVSPLLSTLKLYAQSFIAKDDENIRKYIIKKIENTVDEAIQSISEISNNLSPHILQNFGLVTAIESFASRMKELKNIDFIVSSSIHQRFKEEIEVTLYRILTELINNTIKYAYANHVHIQLKISEFLEVEYSDNGRGFDFLQTREEKKGLGLFNIIQRVKSLGGQIDFNTAPGMGFEVKIKIPVNE